MKNIVLFDGVCNFCNATVLFLIKHDAHENLHFASLQSQIGKDLLEQYTIPGDTTSVIFIHQGQVFLKSDAVLEIAKCLNGWPRILKYSFIISKVIRNGIYDLIAKNRYSIFGKKDNCSIPSAENKKRFLS
jgi:predicted DCC family thiol-disulfide oxidoreductase YuxK